MARENFIITDYRVEESPPNDLSAWPDGAFLLDLVRPYLNEQAIGTSNATTSTSTTATITDSSAPTTATEKDKTDYDDEDDDSIDGKESFLNRTKDPLYWQVAIQWALLQKYGYLSTESTTAATADATTTATEVVDATFTLAPEQMYKNKQSNHQDSSSTTPAPILHFTLSRQQANTITSLWNNLVANVKQTPDKDNIINDNKDTDGDTANFDNDLMEFLSTWRSSKHGRVLRWSIMHCAPGCQFAMHAHPNIEVVYCLSGQLYGIRMQGQPLTKQFDTATTTTTTAGTTTTTETTTKLIGPDLSHCNQAWYFETLCQGEFLVNEVGSIHKSFTATNGNGAILLVLWGGSHANIDETKCAPTSVNVVAAVEEMDQKVSKHALGTTATSSSSSKSGCMCGGPGEKIQQIFLPESERTNQVEEGL